MTINIKILPAYQGDAILLSLNDGKNCIMIDTGTKKSYSKGIIKSEFKSLNLIDLLVLTHTDADHIGGILKYFVDKNRIVGIFKNVWFNTGDLICNELQLEKNVKNNISITDGKDLQMSVDQGVTLEHMLVNENLLHKYLIKARDIYNFDFGNIFILSPEIEDLQEFYNEWEVEYNNQLEMTVAKDYHQTIEELIKVKYKESGSLANKVSIAFILETVNLKMLLMGDAFPSVIEKNIRKLGFDENKKLRLDIVKVSHHGSSSGISPTLLNIIDCSKFIISTNGSNGLPFKECLARLITHRKEKVQLYFNYKNKITENIFLENELKKHNFEILYLTEENNYTISLSEKD